MRRFIILSATILSFTVYPAWAAPSKAEQFHTLILETNPANALIIGDSLTAGLPHLDGTSIAGVTGSGVRTWTQYAEKIVKKTNPKHILVALGTNDAVPDVDIKTWTARYEALCVNLAQRGARITVSTILPVRPRVSGVSPSAIRQMNQQIAALSEKYGYGFVDSWKAMADASGYLKPEYAAPDGIHLNQEGYSRWVKFLYTGE